MADRPSRSVSRTDTLESTARAGIESLSMLIQERDDAARERDMWRDECIANRARLEEMERGYALTKAEHDYYHRLSTTLQTRLYDIGEMIRSSVQEARDAAHSGGKKPERTATLPMPTRTPPPPTPPDEEATRQAQQDSERLAALAAKLAPNTDPEPIPEERPQ